MCVVWCDGGGERQLRLKRRSTQGRLYGPTGQSRLGAGPQRCCRVLPASAAAARRGAAAPGATRRLPQPAQGRLGTHLSALIRAALIHLGQPQHRPARQAGQARDVGTQLRPTAVVGGSSAVSGRKRGGQVWVAPSQPGSPALRRWWRNWWFGGRQPGRGPFGRGCWGRAWRRRRCWQRWRRLRRFAGCAAARRICSACIRLGASGSRSMCLREEAPGGVDGVETVQTRMGGRWSASQRHNWHDRRRRMHGAGGAARRRMLTSLTGAAAAPASWWSSWRWSPLPPLARSLLPPGGRRQAAPASAASKHMVQATSAISTFLRLVRARAWMPGTEEAGLTFPCWTPSPRMAGDSYCQQT